MCSLGVNQQGFILREVSRDKIPESLILPILEVTDVLLNYLGDDIHSLYLYGSTVSGKFVTNQSDLDILLIYQELSEKRVLGQAPQLAKSLSQTFKKVFTDVDISGTSLTEAVAEQNLYGWGCFLKILCVNIYGPDLVQQFPNFQPDTRVAQGFNGDIGVFLRQKLKQLEALEAEPEQEIQKICKSSMKKLIRTSFSLVMPKERCWVTELEDCVQIFLKYYPEQQPHISSIFELVKNPSGNKAEVIELIDNFGQWLVNEFHQKINGSESNIAAH